MIHSEFTYIWICYDISVSEVHKENIFCQNAETLSDADIQGQKLGLMCVKSKQRFPTEEDVTWDREISQIFWHMMSFSHFPQIFSTWCPFLLSQRLVCLSVCLIICLREISQIFSTWCPLLFVQRLVCLSPPLDINYCPYFFLHMMSFSFPMLSLWSVLREISQIFSTWCPFLSLFVPPAGY